MVRTGYKVLDCMTRKPVTVTPETTLQECAEIMYKHQVGGLPVEKDGKLAGILTDSYIVKHIVAKGINPVPIKAEEVMCTELVTVPPDIDIFDALLIMQKSKVKYLPVEHKGKFLGLLTLKDILKVQPQLFEIIAEKIELREERRKPVRSFAEGNEGICELCGCYTGELHEVYGVFMCLNCKDYEET